MVPAVNRRAKGWNSSRQGAWCQARPGCGPIRKRAIRKLHTEFVHDPITSILSMCAESAKAGAAFRLFGRREPTASRRKLPCEAARAVGAAGWRRAQMGRMPACRVLVEGSLNRIPIQKRVFRKCTRHSCMSRPGYGDGCQHAVYSNEGSRDRHILSRNEYSKNSHGIRAWARRGGRLPACRVFKQEFS